jgi:hypothetical protein
VVKLVDTQDLKSCLQQCKCGFKSRLGHSETRSQSGFQRFKDAPGQKPGQISKRNNLSKFDDELSLVNQMKKQTLIAPYKLCKPYVGPHEYFASFHWYNRSLKKYVREKVRVDLRDMNADQKLSALQKISDKFNKVLIRRNNNGQYHDSFVKAAIEKQDYLVAEAMVLVAESDDKKLSGERKKTLKETANNILAFQKDIIGFKTTRIDELSELFIEQFIEWCYTQKRAGKSINKYLATIQFTTQWLTRKKVITESFDTILYRVLQPKNESGIFPPLTHDEKVRAFSFFVHKHPNYNLYLFWLYYTCIRGAELYRIRRKDIDFEAKTVYLSFYSQKSGMKNGLSKFVQL